MAELPPLFVDLSDVYTAASLGQPYNDLITEGVVGTSVPLAAGRDLAVSQRGAGADLSVDVVFGTCWVKGDSDPDAQPMYRCRNDDTVNLVITPDASQPRIVRIVAQVRDDDFDSNGNRDWQLQAVHGDPAASPTAPVEPVSAITLALVAVAASAMSVADGDITDARPVAAANIVTQPLHPAFFIPEGAVIPWVGAYDYVPNGWLLCDGAAVSRSTYADLFAVVGTTYGVGDGSSTFNLPDLRGRVPVGPRSSPTPVHVLGDDEGLAIEDRSVSHIHHYYGQGGSPSGPGVWHRIDGSSAPSSTSLTHVNAEAPGRPSFLTVTYVIHVSLADYTRSV